MPAEAMDVDGDDGEGQAAAADLERPTKVVTENIDLLLRAKVIVANCRPVRASAPFLIPNEASRRPPPNAAPCVCVAHAEQSARHRRRP